VILAIDPGTRESGWVLYDGKRIADSGVHDNHDLLRWVQAGQGADTLAIEMMFASGMPAGNDQFRTLVWIGRFVQAWREPEAVLYVDRRDVKLHLCQSARAKDPNIRQALIDAIGPQGVKSKPGPTYGVKSHAWAALAVAVTALHQLGQQVETQPAPLFREHIPISDPFEECTS